MLNSCTFIGRLVRDVEVKITKNGKELAQLTLAVDNRGKDAGTTYIKCVAFGDTAKFIAQYTRKGTLAAVIGSLKQTDYTNKDGKPVKDYEVLVDQFRSLERAPAPSKVLVEENEVEEEDDEDLPF